jgi:serine O-acetyltransferase
MHLRLHSLARWCALYRIPLVPSLIQSALFLLFNCILPATVRIGSGTRIWHHGWCLAIHPNTEIGRDCNLYNQVEIASSSGDPDDASVHIVIGDRVNICTGAKVLCAQGTLTIGEGSIIAANAVVMSNVPPHSFVVGIPGQCKPLKRADAKVATEPVLVG